MFLSWYRSVAQAVARKSEMTGGRGRRVAPHFRRRMLVETLESRLAPANASLSLPTSGFSGNGGGGTIVGVPVTVTALANGLGAVNIPLTFQTGVFNFPIGNNSATADVSLGHIPTTSPSAAANWNLTANSTADGQLNITLAAKPGKTITGSVAAGTLVLINFPISPNYNANGAGTSVNQTITIAAHNGSFNAQIVQGGSAGGTYTLSPAPPYTGTVTVNGIATKAPTVLAAGTTATGTAVVDTTNMVVSSVTITNAGSGYTAAPTVTFIGGDGSGATGTAVLGTGATAGQVASVNITNGGSAYLNLPPIVSFSPAPLNFSTESNTTINQAAPGVLAGASDPQHTAVTVNMINGAAYTIGTPVTLPSGASLTVNQDGSFSYVPAPNFVGQDSFTFNALNFYNQESNTGSVKIAVVPTLSIVPVGSTNLMNGDMITEDVVMDNPNPSGGVGPVSGFNVAITYDPTVLSTPSDGSGTLLGAYMPADWTFTPNAQTPGVVGIGAFGSGSGSDLVTGPAPIVLATITFTVVGHTTTTTNIDLVAAVQTASGSASTAISGSTGTFFLNPSLPGQVTGLALTNAGTGYTSPPSITFAGGGGTGASAVATLVNGGMDSGGDPIQAIQLTSQGNSYTSAPQVIIDGTGGATATATISPVPIGAFIPGVDTQVMVSGVNINKPTVTVTTAPPASVPENTTVNASGTFTSDVSTTITKIVASEGTVVPAAPGTATGSWTWSESPPLVDNSHTVTITVTDGAGQTAATTFTFSAADVNPTVTVTTSPPSNVTNTTNVSAAGTFADYDDDITSLTASEGTLSPAAPGTTSGNWTWSENAPLTNGAHTVTITAINLDGSTGTTSFTFTVGSAASPPVLTVTTSPTSPVPENTNVSASGTFSDPSDNVTKLTASEGTVSPAAPGTASGNWTWSENAPLTDGSHTVTITGTDAGGTTGTTTFTFTVSDVNPTIVVTSSPTAPVPENTNASASGTFADFDDNITKLSASEGTVTPPAPGTTSGNWTWSETAPLNDGSHTVTITATNANGSTGSTTFTFTVSDVNPTIVVTTSPTSPVPENTNASASGTFADFDDNITKLSASEGTVSPAAPGTTSGNWTWSETAPLTDGSHTVTITATNALGSTGTTTFTFTVSDVKGTIAVTNSPTSPVPENTNASATGTFADFDDNVTKLSASEGTVTPAAPGTTSGNWSWSETAPLTDGAHTVTVTATNADGTTASTSFTFTVSDVNPTVTVTSSPTSPVPDTSTASAAGTFADYDDNITKLSASEGTVSPAAPGTTSGNWTWTESPPLTDGSHTVTITATNANGTTGSTTFTFTVQAATGPHVAVTTSPTSVPENTTANASGTFAATATSATVTSLTSSEGTVTPTGLGTPSGSWTWSESPPLTDGSHTVTITATDSNGVQGSTTFTFTVTDVAPTLAVTTSPTSPVPENTNASAAGTFADFDDNLTSLTASEGTVTPPAPGTTSGNWTWSETAPLTNGSHTVTITGVNARGTTGTTTFTFTVSDVNPTIVVTSSPTVPVADNQTASAAGTFADFDDNITKLSASEGAVLPAAPGTASGNWTWTESPPLTDGSHTVTITATNANGATGSTTFTFTVIAAGGPELVVTTSPTSVPENQNASATGTFSDPAANVTSLTSSEGTVTPAAPGTTSGTWSWSESAPLTNGSHTVTITGTDSNGNKGSTSFTFTVTDVNPTVTVTTSPTSPVPENTNASAAGTFADFDDNVTKLSASEGTVSPAAPGTTSGNWSWSETAPLSNGSHTVTITATNANGSTGTTTFTFTVTDVNPTIVVTSSPTSPLPENTNASAAGTFADYDDNITSLTSSEGTVSPAAPGTTSGNWTWSETAPLTEGAHTVTVTATNANGSTDSTTFTFTVSDVKPTVVVTSSPTGNVPDNTTASAAGTFADFDDNVTKLSASEGTVAPAAPGTASGNWTWTESPPLTDGSHTVTITATNADGGTGSTTFTFTVVAAVTQTSPVYVDPTFTGPNGSDPSTDPGLNLKIGVNAFSTITAALPAVTPTTGKLVIFAGTYTEPSVNFNVNLSEVDIATNPSDPLSPNTVTINGPVTMTDSEAFKLQPVATGTGTSVAANLTLGSTEAGPGTMTVSGMAVLTFDGAVSGPIVLAGSDILNASAPLTLAGSGSLTLADGVSDAAGSLSSSSSNTSVVLGAGSSFNVDGFGSSTFAGTISGSGTLIKPIASTSLTLTGNSSTFTGTVDLSGGTLTVNGSLGTSTNPINLSDSSSVLNGSGNVNMPVVIKGTASGASVAGVTITAASGTGIDVQSGASSVAISGVTVKGSTTGILAEAGNYNTLSITGSTLTGDTMGIEAQNGCITATGNNITSNGVGVQVQATATPLLTLEGNSITGNTAGLQDENPGMQVTAILNWWGSSTGPTTGEVVGVNVDNYTPYALDATSAGIGATTFDFFNGTGTDGNVYVTPTSTTSADPVGQNTITATADTTNSNLVHVTVNGTTANYLRGGSTNRVIIYGFGDHVAGTHSTISVTDNAAAVWNAQINSEALKFREPIGFGGISSTKVTTSGFGNDVIFGGGNDTIMAMTSGNNVLVAGLSSGKTGAPTAPFLFGGSGKNIYIAGSVDCALVDNTKVPNSTTGRLDYETLRQMDDFWAGTAGGSAGAMSDAALYSIVNKQNIMTGTARAVIIPGGVQSWFIVKGTTNPTNTPGGLDQDYVAAQYQPSSPNSMNFRQSIS